jgi:hypothetical protein
LSLAHASLLLPSRLFILKESSVWRAKRKTLLLSGQSVSLSWEKIGFWLYHYWHRLFICAMGWFVWDFAFYGNKLFQVRSSDAVPCPVRHFSGCLTAAN